MGTQCIKNLIILEINQQFDKVRGRIFMTIPLNKNPDYSLKRIVQQTFKEPGKIESIAKQHGYLLNGSFLPHEFQQLCKIVTEQMLNIVQERIRISAPHHQNIISEIRKETEELVQNELKKVCRVIPPTAIRNPPPILWSWIASFWQ